MNRACLIALLISFLANTAVSDSPNFVFFLVDDLGWADVGCYGSTFYETPNIDALSASGMQFFNGYAASPVCSPTRASIMTGRHPVRVDITDWIPGSSVESQPIAKFEQVHDRDNLALDEVTIAEALQAHGYETFFAGKWHLGSEGHWPTDQGFDHNHGGWEKGSPVGGYYAPWINPTLVANKPDEYLTERLTEESLKFLGTRDVDRPFLLFLSYYNVHTPIEAYKKRIEHFRDKVKRENLSTPSDPILEHGSFSRSRQDHPAMASMISAVDDSVGAILRELHARGLDEDTVVIFFSDNGGLCTNGKRPGPTCNLPLRSGKGWLYEGGIREPMIIRAPGVTKPGSSCETPVVSMDFFPTILELAGTTYDRVLDGVSLVPLLAQTGSIPERALCWHYPHYHGSSSTPTACIRKDDWKLIRFYHHEKAELFHLGEDPGERNDCSSTHANIVLELTTALEAWQHDMHARMPVPQAAD